MKRQVIRQDQLRFVVVLTGIALAPFFSGCKQDNPTPTLTSVFMAGSLNGSTGGFRTYWKDTVAVTSLEHSFATSIAVSGGDVYMAGYGPVGTCYWKNGIAVKLDGYIVSGMAVAGNDVYVAGIGPDEVVYWKNGIPVTLPGGIGGTDIEVSGKDIYVAGIGTEGNTQVARCWKNGAVVPLTGSTNGYTTSVAVLGNDIYVAGSVENGGTQIAVFWKNGLQTILTNNVSAANSIFVTANGVYVAGSETGVNAHTGTSFINAKYWKDGTSVILNGEGFASAIAVTGNDVYAVGNETYWKNGVAVKLSTGSGKAEINSIFIAQ